MGFFGKIFGLKPKKDLGEMISRGALIVDVRSAQEYKSGHIKGSVNIPLDKFSNKAKKLDRSKPTIVCCASGMRSSTALTILKSNGFEEAANGGGWQSLRKYVN